MKVIAIANQKGGVGKTTTAVNLAHGLARHGHTVVVFDLDSQGNAATCFGVEPAGALHRLIVRGESLRDVAIQVRERLWLIRSDGSTERVKQTLVSMDYREYVLQNVMTSIRADYVILDTSPSRDLLTTNAHHAAGEVIVPVKLNHLALVGVAQEVETIKNVQQHGHDVQVLAILPTFFDQVTKETELNYHRLVEQLGSLVLPAVPVSTRLREAARKGKTIWEYLRPNRDGRVLEAYERLMERVIEGV
jgi:chromosome partitioning protein